MTQRPSGFPNNPPSSNHTSKTGFAKATGYTRDQVKHMYKKERLVTEGPWVLIEESLKRIAETETKRAITEAVIPAFSDEAQLMDGEEHKANFGRMFLEARARKEQQLAIKSELENQARRGDLIEMALVKKMMGDRTRAFRDGLTTSPRRLAPIIAGQQDVREIEKELAAEFRYLLEQWAKEPLV